MERLEALGPAALGVVTARAATLPTDSAVRKDLEAVARRLACTVVKVRIVDESKEVPAELRDQLEALKGKVLDAHAVIRTFVVAIDRTLVTSGGVRLDVERSVESPGVVVSLRVFSRRSSGDGCSTAFAARIGRKQLGFRGGSGIAEVWRSESEFEDEQETIERVLGAPVDQSFEIHLERGIR